MRNKLALIAGFGLGYVLGTRAGHQRYEQIKSATTKLVESDGFQHTKDTVSDKLHEWLPRPITFVFDVAAGFASSLIKAATGDKRSSRGKARRSLES